MNVWTERDFDEQVHGRRSDGRHIDRARAKLTGEAADQRVDRPVEGSPLIQDVERGRLSEPRDSPTYYELAPVKAPPWKWYVPAYFYVGGVTGATAVLAACAQWRPSLAPLTARARTVAVAGYLASAALLVADLGRPSRFIYMLRVFRPTSPMNLGSWLLSVGGAASGAAWLFGRGAPRRSGLGAGAVAGIGGAALSVYTAVLLANTAVPLWSRARTTMPWLFAASAAASSASFLSLVLPEGSSPLRRLGILGKAGELVAARAVEREAHHPRLRQALHGGRGGRLWRSAKLFTGLSLVFDLAPRPTRPTRFLSALFGTAGAILGRFAITEAGKATASDPRATFESQRDAPPPVPPPALARRSLAERPRVT